MTLADCQGRFMAEISAPDDGPASSSLGMAIYRNAYRARLAQALAASFERTRRWIGVDMFDAAAAHYILSHPPGSWTLDAYGAQFPALLAELFGEDPEVAELAWLEWQMQQAFAAPDSTELTPHDLANAGLAEADWEDLCLVPAPSLAWRRIDHDLAPLWHGLAEVDAALPSPPEVETATLLVWRKDLSPHFRQLDHAEWAALEPLLQGRSFGEAAAQVGEEGLARFGQWFAQWLGEGLFAAIRR